MLRVIILSLIFLGWSDGTPYFRTYFWALVKYRWPTMEYEFPNKTTRQQAIDAKLYVPSAPIPIDFHYHYSEVFGSRRFITTPRIAPGVPATIGYLPNDTSTNIQNPSIIPYPNWEMNKIDGNCDHIISVYRIQIDQCDRLWIIDTGFNENVSICPPKILIYNLLTDQLIRTYKFDKKKLLSGTKLMTTVIDIPRNNCDNAFAYIADPERCQLIVYSYKTDSSWTIRNRHFFPDPDHGILTINNTDYDVMSGISGMALGLEDRCGGRNLYFHTFGSVEQQYVPTWVLKRANPDTSMYEKFPMETSQSTTMAITKTGIIFFMSLSDKSIKCWNTNVNALAIKVDTTPPLGTLTGEFPTSFQIEVDEDGTEYLLTLCITTEAMFHGTVDPDAYPGISLLKWKVHDIIKNTWCDRDHPFDVLPPLPSY